MDWLFEAFLIAVGLNLLIFVPAYFLKTDKLTDISYSVTFIILAILSFSHSSKSPAHSIVLFMVLVWAFRLGGFLFIRINKKGKDSRFDEMRSRPWSFLRFWFFQGLTVFIVLLPSLLLWHTTLVQISILSYVGWVIYGFGLVLETIADFQKNKFNNNPVNKNHWIDSGVWRTSRHPNYLGEILVWVGIYIFCFTALPAWDKLFGLASPLYIYLILRFFSGIPLLEKSSDQKWGQDKAYQTYKTEVPLLLPTPTSLSRL